MVGREGVTSCSVSWEAGSTVGGGIEYIVLPQVGVAEALASLRLVATPLSCCALLEEFDTNYKMESCSNLLQMFW